MSNEFKIVSMGLIRLVRSLVGPWMEISGFQSFESGQNRSFAFLVKIINSI